MALPPTNGRVRRLPWHPPGVRRVHRYDGRLLTIDQLVRRLVPSDWVGGDDLERGQE